MLDWVCKRYSSPFVYLDILLENDMFLDGLKLLREEEDNEKLWQLYLHSHPETSFEEWKEKVTKKQPQKTTSLTDDELVAQQKEAENILNSLQM